MVTYPSVKATGGVLDAIAGGGKVTLGTVPGGAKYEGLTALPGDVLGIVLGGLVFVLVAFVLPERLSGEGIPPAAAE